MALGLNQHVIVVWIVTSCYPGSANSTLLCGFDGLRIHPYHYPMHQKVLKHFIYIWHESVIQFEVALGPKHVIVVWLYPVVLQVQPSKPISMALME